MFNWFKKKTAIITLVDGVEFDIINPEWDKIKITDIALSLSNLCRFNGQIVDFYSVAEHSINVSNYLQNFQYSPQIVLAGLLHDASEAYCGDVTTPLKKHLGKKYKIVEHNLMLAIGKRFDIDFIKNKDLIKFFDNTMYSTENAHLKLGKLDKSIRCLEPRQAREEFLYKFSELWKEIDYGRK